MWIRIVTIHFLKTVGSFERTEAKNMGVHFLNAQGGWGLNLQHIQRKIGPPKGIVNHGQFANSQTAHLPWEAQVADKAWSEVDGGLIT